MNKIGINTTGRLVVAALLAVAALTCFAEDKPVVSTLSGSTDFKAIEKQLQTMLEKVQPCVVSVAGGSGVIVSADGLVLTAAHVGDRAQRQLVFTFPDGRRARGVTLGNDHGGDAGLMKITDPGPWPFAELGNVTDLKAGQWCVAIGYPVTFAKTRTPTVRLGRIQHACPKCVLTDCTIMGGDSGGPLVDLVGRVIGISSTCDDSVHWNFHVPVNRYISNWDRLAKGEDWDDRKPTELKATQGHPEH